MKYLTIEEILFMHHRLLVELQPDNEDFTILNPGYLEAAIARPQQSAFGQDAYHDAYSKAAALTESLIGNHCFQDGNKRIGITAGIVFLINSGFQNNASQDDVVEAAMNTANGEWKFEKLRTWFEQNFY
jgi:death-on-curing protein